MRSIRHCVAVLALISLLGCQDSKPEYGVEDPLFLPGTSRQTWAVAPIVNLSGIRQADPILQADLVYGQLQQVAGVNAIPVNRVVEAYAAMRIDQVQTEEQAALVCDILGADALLVGTITAYDPYDPPKLGASLTLFRRTGARQTKNLDPRELARAATPTPDQTLPRRPNAVQVVGMFDAANGSIRSDLARYARGRNDPTGAYKERAYLVEMDRYCGFVYHSLLEELLSRPALR